MASITATDARSNLYKLIAQVNSDCTPVTIVNTRGKKNAVLIGEDDWNAIEETLYLNSIPGLADDLIALRDNPKEGSFVDYEELTW